MKKVHSDTTINIVPGKYSGWMPPVPTVESNILDHSSVHDLSKSFTPSSGIRVMMSNKAISKYGTQAETMDIESVWPEPSLISTTPVHSGSHSDLSGNSQISSLLGTNQPAFTAGTTIDRPIKDPKIDGNSGPKTCATIT